MRVRVNETSRGSIESGGHNFWNMTACPVDTAEEEWNAGPGVYGSTIEINNVNDLSVVSDVNVFNGRGVHKTRRPSVLLEN